MDLFHPRGFVVVQRTDGVDFLHSTLLAKFHLRKPAPGRLLSKPASRIEMASSVKECLSSFSAEQIDYLDHFVSVDFGI